MQSDWPQAERAELLALFGVPRAILPMVPGHADGGNVGGACAGIAPRTAPGFDGRRPQILRLVLDLAAGGKVLRELALGNGGDRVSARNSMARGDVVPCSMGRT